MTSPHRHLTRLLTAVLTIVAATCLLALRTPTADSQPTASAGCGGAAPSPGDSVLAIRSGGVRRTAVVHVSPRAVGRPAALLVAFHGTGASGRVMERYSGLVPQLDRDGAIGVFPDADGPRWDVSERERPDDVDFVRDLLRAVSGHECVDPTRVTAAGVSNGGSFAALLACALSDRLAGVAIVAGDFAPLPPCRPRRPVSILEIHGTADPVVPYAGRAGDGHRGAVLPWVRAWARRDGCPATLRRRVLAPRTVQIAWEPCRAGAAVAHVAIFGGRHQWPGATPPDPGPAATLSAAQAAWGFLVRRQLAGG